MKKYVPVAVLMFTVFAGVAIIGTTGNSRSAFDVPRLNDGIAVNAPDEWRWVRDGISLDSFLAIAGKPDVIEATQSPNKIEGAMERVVYSTGVAGATHVFLFDKDGFLRFAEWFNGLQDAADDVPAPSPSISDNLKITYPRLVPMAWSGDSEHGFEILVEIKYSDGRWATSKKYYTSQTRAVHQHTGANDGRWKIRSLSESGGGKWSGYTSFKCVE